MIKSYSLNNYNDDYARIFNPIIKAVLKHTPWTFISVDKLELDPYFIRTNQKVFENIDAVELRPYETYKAVADDIHLNGMFTAVFVNRGVTVFGSHRIAALQEHYPETKVLAIEIPIHMYTEGFTETIKSPTYTGLLADRRCTNTHELCDSMVRVDTDYFKPRREYLGIMNCPREKMFIDEELLNDFLTED